MPDHPPGMLRKYYLISEDRGTGGDLRYALVFTSRGEMLVEVTHRPEERYKAPQVHEIPARDFASTTVRGVPLLTIVMQKLNEILPTSH
jgi:hypothetical protein